MLLGTTEGAIVTYDTRSKTELQIFNYPAELQASQRAYDASINQLMQTRPEDFVVRSTPNSRGVSQTSKLPVVNTQEVTKLLTNTEGLVYVECGSSASNYLMYQENGKVIHAGSEPLATPISSAWLP